MSETDLLNELLDAFAHCLDAESARRVTELRIAPAVQKRAEELAGRANEGLLAEHERSEYESLISAADFISILKRKAQRRLDSNTNS